MEDGRNFRDALSDDSDINELIDWFERDDVSNIVGRIGSRIEDSNQWETFTFTLTTDDDDESKITINDDDIPDDFDWNDFFDYLDYLAEEYDIDYHNEYAKE